MKAVNAGKYDISFYGAPNYNKPFADHLPYDAVIDFGDAYNKTIAAEISDGFETRKIALVAPFCTPQEDIESGFDASSYSI